MQTDQSILTLLSQEPENGMAALIGEYSGLLWTVCRQYLPNTEDVKDCINETFSEFYLHKDRFDPQKGTLKGYLAVIARRCALHRREENRRWEAVPPAAEEEAAPDPLAHLEDRETLEAALSALNPVDEQIIRMKYYGGMTAREIAVSLNLPYETVKKRHQRSMKKLLKGLSIGLIVVVLLALVTACAYMVLRHFGFVPGYGVNTNPEAAVYVLEDGAVIQGEDYEFQLEDAYWRDGTLIVDLKLCSKTTSDRKNLLTSLSGLENSRHLSTSQAGNTAPGIYSIRIIYEGDLPENCENTLNLTLTMEGTAIPLTLLAAEETALDQVGFYDITPSDGGLLAVPRIENGELVVSIHPLDEGDFRTYFFLNRGPWTGYGGPELPVTVTAPDGTVLEGEPAPYSPFSGDTSLDWYFGPAEPGEYTLNVPYVYQMPAETETETVDIPLPGAQGSAGRVLDLPGGRLLLGDMTQVSAPAAYTGQPYEDSKAAYYTWWTLETLWEGDDPQRIPAMAPLRVVQAGSTEIDGTNYQNAEVKHWIQTAADPDTGDIYRVSPGYVLGALGNQDSITVSLNTENIFYRWNHPFSIKMTVPPEEEREEFTQIVGDYSLSAVPRRTNDQVTVSLRPSTPLPYIIPSADISRGPQAAMGVSDEPITLTAADGIVYEGIFQSGRTEDYSDWTFGDIPGGTYTLHVPYLYITEESSRHIAVPLPQEEGQTLPVGSLHIGFGSDLVLDTITGLSPDTAYDPSSTNMIINVSGYLSNPAQTPLTSLLTLSMQSDHTPYTLVDIGLRMDTIPEEQMHGACVRQYAFEESGMRMNGLLFRHIPGLYAANLTIVNPTYRWNHSFDISVTIPE